MEEFEKKQYIYSETMGVCQVADIVKLSANGRLGEQVPYYLLKSAFDKSKVAYIPVEKHQVGLRALLSREEAQKIADAGMDRLGDRQKEEVCFVLEQR